MFSTTRWTVVLAAGQSASPQSDAALAELCRTYWYPLYAYVRRQGNNPEDAQDLTQDFFARLLERNYLAKADRDHIADQIIIGASAGVTSVNRLVALAIGDLGANYVSLRPPVRRRACTVAHK